MQTHVNAARPDSVGVSRARSFITVFMGSAACLAAVLLGTLLLLDPYGVSPFRASGVRPIMDINQRYMYPQIVRRQAFDSVVIGTSTSRLLDPEALNRAFGGRFANLAMNAGTAWEQVELAKLYLRYTPRPRAMILGLDQMWCLPENAIERITFRGFPTWMYDENPFNDLPEVFNLKTFEIAGRVAAYHLGLMPERIRGDGYEVFTPPEATYDLSRARFHIWKERGGNREIAAQIPAYILTPAEEQAMVFPAIAWLDALLTRLPPETRRTLVYMPLHVSIQPTPGTETDAHQALCKRRIDAVAARHGARVIDFAIPSPITREDANYWDPLHYRLPIAEQIIAGMKQAIETGASDPDGVYQVR